MATVSVKGLNDVDVTDRREWPYPGAAGEGRCCAEENG